MEDVRQSQPFQDAWWLLRSPREFWRRVEVEFDGWVMMKALGGMLVLLWLVSFATSPIALDRAYSALSIFSDAFYSLADRMAGRWGLTADDILPASEGLDGSLLSLAWVGVLLRNLTAPLGWMMSLLTSSAGVCLALPLVGVALQRVSFPLVFTIGAYAHWFAFFQLFPGVGSVASGVLIYLVFGYGLKCVYRLSLGSALLCLSAIPMLYMLLAGFLGLVFTMSVLIASALA